MIQTPITLKLRGHPAPKGSLKCIGARGEVKHQLVEDERTGQKPWRKAITNLAGQARQRADQHQPIGVAVTFTIDRGPTHFGSGRNAAFLNARAPLFPTKQNTNDVDKMVRLLLDALQDSGVLVDDAQVVQLSASKVYPTAPPESLAGPKPPPWAATYRAPLDALPYAGAVVRIYPAIEED